MKVGTDGVLLGSWCPLENTENILDIGTGTGLIALMLAQRSKGKFISAIEIDKQACLQANDNLKNSPWPDRVELVNTALQKFKPNFQYDLIVCNPPYFTGKTKPPDNKRNIARHTEELSFPELTGFIDNHLSPKGRFCLVIPSELESAFTIIAEENNLFVYNKVKVFPTPNKGANRVLLEFRKIKPAQLIIEELVIEVKRHVYSKEFYNLVKEFYLNPIHE